MLLINQIRYALNSNKKGGSDRNVDRNWSVTLHFFHTGQDFLKVYFGQLKSKRVDKKKLLLECLYYSVTNCFYNKLTIIIRGRKKAFLAGNN